MKEPAKPALSGLICAGVLILWQSLTVWANYGGNWTALYCTGALVQHAPLVEQEHIYIFANSVGYDGQLYHLVAHDPLMRRGLAEYVDSPRYRYTRILVPGLAYALALGKQEWIDPAYRVVIWLFAFLGGYWMSRFAALCGRSPWWGLAFLAIPSTLISADRLVVDMPMAALCAGFAYYAVKDGFVVLAILAVAPLCRETGLFLVAAYAATCAIRRLWRHAALACALLAPFLTWTAFVNSRTPPHQYNGSLIPGIGMLHAFLSPQPYAEWTAWIWPLRALDTIALAGVLLAFLAAIALAVRRWRDPVILAAGLLAGAGLVFQTAGMFEHVYGYGRVWGTLLVLLFLEGLRMRRALLCAPVWMMTPRVLVQLAPQVMGIVAALRSAG